MLFKFFWIICGLWVGLGGALMGKVNSKKLIAAEKLSSDEINPLLLGWFFCIFVPSTLFWIIQLSISGEPHVDFLTWPNPQKYIALGLLISCWSALITWVLFLGGAPTLSKVLMLMGNSHESMLKPTSIKILTILIVVSGVLSLFMPRI